MRCTLLVSRVWAGFVALALPLACSDDGVPQDGTGSTGNADATASDTDPTTDPSTTSPTTTTATTATTDATTDPTTDSITSTDPSDTSGVVTDPDSSGSGTDTSGTDTSGTDTSGSTGESSSGSSSSDDGTGALPTGAGCAEDEDCASGVCWDFNDYDELCFGAACSVECRSDDECAEAFEEAGAQTPEKSFCGRDGRCWVVGTGLGGFACAMEPAAMLGG